MKKDKNNRMVNYRFSLLPILFFIFIMIPSLNDILGFYKPGIKLRENRRTVKRPSLEGWDLKTYLKKYTKYYRSGFSFRSSLVFFNNFLRVKLFNRSPVDRVMIGKDGWLFIKKLKENGREVDYSRSIERFSQEKLELWRRIFDERFEWLEKKGIKMFIVLVPNKSTIYPEFLPRRIKGVTSQVRTDQLVEYFRRHSKVHIVDLRDVMIASKHWNRLYYKTDSHWNWFGTYIGYREIMKYLSLSYSNIHPKPFDFFLRKRISFPRGGDLAVMLSLQNTLFREEFYRLFPGSGVKIVRERLKDFHRKHVNAEITFCNTGKLPKTVMIHDSFGLRLRKMMSTDFSSIIYLRDWGFNIFPDLIEKEKPAIVIYEIAERFLHNFSLKNPEEIVR